MRKYITRFIRETNAKHDFDVMEMVIEFLSIAFGVSKQVAKIRMVELGFEKLSEPLPIWVSITLSHTVFVR